MTNKQQFDEFIVKHLDNAYKLANVYVKNENDAEDVVAESIEKALHNINTLRDTELMKEWFNKILVNTSINYLKKQAKHMATGNTVSSYYFDDFSALYFEDLLNLLPEPDRTIIDLRFRDNCALKEIAETLGMKENTVKTRLYRALRRLQLTITGDGNGITVITNSKTPIFKNVALPIIVIILSTVCVFNLSPTLAAAAYDVPVIGDIVRVITLNRFTYNDKGYKAELNVPEIQGLLDPELQDRLNSEFREFAEELIIGFESVIIEMQELGIEDEESAIEQPRMSIKADYVIKTDNDLVLAIDSYIYSEVNGFTNHKIYTIDKRVGKLVTLESLFKPGSDYITPISRYIYNEMVRLNEEEDALFEVGDDGMFEGFNEIRPNQNFYINGDSKLVICFDKYEVAAGVQGSPEFIIPTEIINSATDSDLIG